MQQQARLPPDANQGMDGIVTATTSQGTSYWLPEQTPIQSKVIDHTQPNEVACVPLGIVVEDAVKRWFEETYRNAQRGDVKQQALLGQMLAEGYGCQRDPKAAEEWIERARKKGFKMQGVYCQL